MTQPTVYQWWGNREEPPPHLKTKKQLASIKMKPIKAVGVIHTSNYDLYLYDPDDPESAVPKKTATEAQLAALTKGRQKQQFQARYRRWYRQKGRFIRDKNEAIEWARLLLQELDRWLILDTETTGLYPAEIVQIGIVNLKGEIILDSLVKPLVPIPPEVTAIHGINDDDVREAPSFSEIYPKLVEAIADKNLVIYNADFDISILNHCCQLHQLTELKLWGRSACAMEYYAQYCGEWSHYYKSYKWQPLGGNHRAIGDCLATLKLIEAMAEDVVIDDLKVYFQEMSPK